MPSENEEISEENDEETMQDGVIEEETEFREPGFGVRAPERINTRGSHYEWTQEVQAIPPAIMLSVKALTNKDWSSLRAEWKTWKFTMQVATGSQNFSEKAKHSLLVMRGGPLIQEIAMDGPAAQTEERIGEPDEPSFTNLLKRIEDRITRTANANHDMARLSEATQTSGESIEAFARRLRDLAKLCNMDNNSTEMMIRNRLFDGATHGSRLAELSLPNPGMTAQEIVAMGTRMEERERAAKSKKDESGIASTSSEQNETTVSAIR